MLKFLENYDEVLDLLHGLSEVPELRPFRIGVAGSYTGVPGKKNTAIDLVLKLRDGEDESLVGKFSLIEKIQLVIAPVYSNKIQIIWLDLLEKDEEKLIDFTRIKGIEANPESAYTNIVAKVRWVDEDEEDKDKIESSIMTWDDEDEFDESKEVDE